MPPGSTVLDVGCASGYLGRALAGRGCRVYGVDGDEAALADCRRGGYVDAVQEDLDGLDALPWDRAFDVIVVADVLEHLRRPEEVLARLLRYLAPAGLVVLSVPNVAHLSVRAGLLAGRFRYTDTGILDRGHLHLYTFETARLLLEGAGLTVERARAGSDRFGPWLARWPAAGRLLRGLLAYNIVLVARAPGPPFTGHHFR